MKLQSILQSEFNDDMSSVTFWDETRGAAPGGTFATILHALSDDAIQAPRSDFNPLLRLPDGSKSEFDCRPNLSNVLARCESPWDKQSGLSRWTGPFVMATVNAEVARWGYAFRQSGSKSATYSESMVYPDFKTAFVNYLGFAMFGSALLNPITSQLLQKYAMPKPGEGPSLASMENKREYLVIMTISCVC